MLLVAERLGLGDNLTRETVERLVNVPPQLHPLLVDNQHRGRQIVQFVALRAEQFLRA